jgi:hypothetical protein
MRTFSSSSSSTSFCGSASPARRFASALPTGPRSTTAPAIALMMPTGIAKSSPMRTATTAKLTANAMATPRTVMLMLSMSFELTGHLP